ncbi:uncharacterized protein LOC109830572 isoform X1 [Asparagus officinalis]|uniref:uncharacterized protein LOC109830572 isoform X1 n=1 Tax=Asparagus officinalis TaxID=4686 RepID=UPI00098E374F|nr:uncharacterized protein LOC109830572 isoform X1 [Asparagus officinalis]
MPSKISRGKFKKEAYLILKNKSSYSAITTQQSHKLNLQSANRKKIINRVAIRLSHEEEKQKLFKHEAVAVTTTLQEEILLEMGIDPRFGIACLGKVNSVYENDRDLMIQFYRFVAKEEMAIDEAELEANEFAEKMDNQQKMQEQQLEMLKYIRKFHPDDQSAVLESDIRTKEIIGRGSKRGLYHLDDMATGRTHYSTSLKANSRNRVWMWHRRLGHPSFGYLKKLYPSLFSGCENEDLNCETCIRAKSHRVSFPRSPNKSTIPFALIHSDVGVHTQ